MLAEEFEVCTTVAVVAAFARMLQWPVEQPDNPPAHVLIPRNGVGFGRSVPAMRPVCHAEQQATKPRPRPIRGLLGGM